MRECVGAWVRGCVRAILSVVIIDIKYTTMHASSKLTSTLH